jgi:hypothetical protein
MDDAAAHLMAFSAPELRMMRRFVTKVDELRASRFLAESQGPMEIRGELAGGLITNIRFEGPDRPLVQEVIGTFRELYGGGHRNHSSATAISKLIGEHAKARGTKAGDHMASQMKVYRQRLDQRASQDSRMAIFSEDPGAVGSSSTITPKQVIDLIINGDLLHYEPAKADQLEEDPQLTAMMWMMLHSTIRDFADHWDNPRRRRANERDDPTRRLLPARQLRRPGRNRLRPGPDFRS